MKASYIKSSLLKTINSMNEDPSQFVKRPGIDFTRKRKCSFASLILCLLTMESHSLNRELRRFFGFQTSHILTKSAFIQQREKLNKNAFPFIFSTLNRIFPSQKVFHGYHLLACDGSDVNLPPLKGDVDNYVASNTEEVGYYQMHINALYDILEERYADVLIQNRADINEREALLAFLDRFPLSEKSIFTVDRGYFSLNTLAHLQLSGHSYLMRMRADDGKSFLSRFQLPDSAEYDLPLDFYATRNTKKRYREHPETYVTIPKRRTFDVLPCDDRETLFHFSTRLVKIRLASGESEYLLTDLSPELFDLKLLKELYHLRWKIETSFRFLKYNIALNYFHCIRRDFIEQEIYARMILYNLTMLLVHCVSTPDKNTKLHYKVSVSDAVITCQHYLIHRILNEEIEALLVRYLTPIRPGRSFPRKMRSKRFVPLTNRT